MKLEVTQNLPVADAVSKSVDNLSSSLEGDVAVRMGDAAALEADAAIEAELRKGPAVLISSPEAEMARGGRYASFKTDEGFVTLGRALPAEGLDALDKKMLDKAVKKAADKSALETEAGTVIDKTALIETAKAKAKAEMAAGLKNIPSVPVIHPGVKQGQAEYSVEPLPKFMRDFNDKSLVQYAKALDELKLPMRESNAVMMSQIMEAKDSLWAGFQGKITMESAAFLASAGIQGEAGVQAALDIANGAKMDTLINSLLALLDGVETPQAETPGQTAPSHEAAADSKAPASVQAAGISDIFTLLAPAKETGIAENLNPPQVIAPSAGHLKGVSSPSNSILAHNGEKPHNDAAMRSNEGMHSDSAQRSGEKPSTTAAQPPVEKGSSASNNIMMHNGGEQQSVITQPVQNSQAQSGATQISLIESGMMGASIAVQDALVNALTELPEFRNTPPKYILKFSDTLTRVLGEENTADGQQGTEGLQEQLDKLFTSIDRSDPDLGKRLSQSKEEMFLRFMLIEEAISRMSFSQRAEAVEQVQQLLNHVRVLNSIEHVVYMQLPVKINEQETTAELYIFKKKGKKRLDPENVNVLLAVDLQHLGRWEGLINIQSKEVSVKMDVSGEQEKDFFGANTVMLHKLLHEIGYKLQNSTITYTGENTTPLTAMLSLEQLQTGRSSNVGAMDYTV